mmetsp:Transcript_15624/g.61061  ORF Transcript_15624/g.61061 Transcript_15624/m.61061 type:complete len:349 (+) Transcript_15624:62-1108(+)
MGDDDVDGVAFRFGVIADPQFADADDHHNFHKTSMRYYRGSLDVVKEAVEHWNSIQSPPVSLVLQLGDLIDGKAQHNGGSEQCLQRVLEEVAQCSCKEWYHAIGNHELYNFTLDELADKLDTRRRSAFEMETAGAGVQPEAREYYDWVPHEGWRFVMLHPFEQNIIEKPRSGPRYEAALKLLRKNNPNDVLKATVNWSEGLRGLQKRFVPFNGAMGSEQIAWLRRVLAHAQSKREWVVICSHLPFLQAASQGLCLLWNYDEVLEVLNDYKLPDCTPVVRLVLSGHDHNGGFAVDERSGVAHLTLASPLECWPGVETAYGVVEAFDDGRLRVRGAGKVPSVRLPPRPPQ